MAVTTARNNTRSLGNGRTGSVGMGSIPGSVSMRRTNNSLTNMVSKSIAESNYEKLKYNDKKVAQLRIYILRMAESWTVEDKINVISQYGDATFLPKKPTLGQINELFARTLIIRLPASDLEKLMKDIIVDEKELNKEIAKVRKTNKKKTAFNAKSFNDVYTLVKDSKSTSELIRSRKAYDDSYKVPRYIQRQYQRLRRELQEVIKMLFDKVQIVGAATRMGIDVPDGISQKDLILRIANRTILYVDLIVGKSQRINIAGSIADVEAYNELLIFTSYAHVTGRPGINAEQLAFMKKQAKEAKYLAKETFRMKEAAWKKNFRFRGNRAVKRYSGRLGIKSNIDLEVNDTGLLADKSLDEILELAARFGVEIGSAKKTRRISAIKRDLYRAIAMNYQREKRFQRRVDRAERQGRPAKESTRRQLAALKKLGNVSSQLSERGTKLPYVNFDKGGNLKNKDILRALPVYVINQWVQEKRKSEISSIDKNLEENPVLSNRGIRRKYGLNSIKEVFSRNKATREKRQEIKELRKNLEMRRTNIMSSLDTGRTKMTDIPIINFTSSTDDIKRSIEIAVPVFVVNGFRNVDGALKSQHRGGVSASERTVERPSQTRQNFVKRGLNQVPEPVRAFGKGLMFTATDAAAKVGKGAVTIAKQYGEMFKTHGKQVLQNISDRNIRILLTQLHTFLTRFNDPNSFSGISGGDYFKTGAIISQASAISRRLAAFFTWLDSKNSEMSGGKKLWKNSLGELLVSSYNAGRQKSLVFSSFDDFDNFILPYVKEFFKFNAINKKVARGLSKTKQGVKNLASKALKGLAKRFPNTAAKLKMMKTMVPPGLKNLAEKAKNIKDKVVGGFKKITDRGRRGLKGDKIPGGPDNMTSDLMNPEPEVITEGGSSLQPGMSSVVPVFVTNWPENLGTSGGGFGRGHAGAVSNDLFKKAINEYGLNPTFTNDDLKAEIWKKEPEKDIERWSKERLLKYIMSVKESGVLEGSSPKTPALPAPKKGLKGRKSKGAKNSPIFRIIGDMITDPSPGRNPWVMNIGRKKEVEMIKGRKAIRVFDESRLLLEGSGEETEASGYFSDNAKSLGISSLRREPASPVYVVNDRLPTDVISGLIDVFATIFAKIPVIGKPISMGLEAISASLDGSLSGKEIAGMLGIPMAATGMHARSGGSASHFISGDSLTSSPNPEQVSVDWSKRSVSVKPIPAFATGGETTAAGKVRQLTTSERNAPMQVGMGVHTVTYKRSLTDVNDEKNKEAIKVYSVNPGIADLVEVGNSKVSLIELTADMAGRLRNIEDLLSTGNAQRTELIKTSAATMTGVSQVANNTSQEASIPAFTGNGFSDLESILKGE